MDVVRDLKGDPYQEFRKEEGLEGLQASARGGAFTATSVPDVSVRNHQPPPVPSISGGFTFRKLSDIQEVPNWSANPLKNRDHHHYSSEDDVTFVPVSQQNGSLHLLTHQKVHTAGNSTRKCFMITSTLDNRNDPFRDMGQPPPELVRDTILQQDAQFREQVQELHRVHEIQVCLMAEMQKQDETKVDATTHASVTTKNKNLWMMMQAPLSKAAFQVSGSSFRHEQITQGAQTGEEERYATSVAHVEQARQFLDGGRKLGEQRTFDLERPPEENMDEDEDESSGEAAAIKVDVEAEELTLRLSTGWAQQADDVPLHQDHLSAIPSKANDIVHKAPFHPALTSATQRFLGGRWGISLERKMNKAEGDCQPADVSHKKQCCSHQLDIESNPAYHCTKMAISPASLCKASRTGTALTRSPQQDARNEDTWFHEQQQQNTWAHSAVGVYQAPCTPQMYAPFKISNETMPLFPASRKGEGPPSSSFAPPVYNQAYALASAAVPVQLQPYECPIALPGQGIVMSAMNVAAWYSHSVPSVKEVGSL